MELKTKQPMPKRWCVNHPTGKWTLNPRTGKFYARCVIGFEKNEQCAVWEDIYEEVTIELNSDTVKKLTKIAKKENISLEYLAEKIILEEINK